MVVRRRGAGECREFCRHERFGERICDEALLGRGRCVGAAGERCASCADVVRGRNDERGAVRPGKPPAVVLERVQLRAQLHAQEQQREGNGDERAERGDHGGVRCKSAVNVSRVAGSGISRSA